MPRPALAQGRLAQFVHWGRPGRLQGEAGVYPFAGLESVQTPPDRFRACGHSPPRKKGRTHVDAAPDFFTQAKGYSSSPSAFSSICWRNMSPRLVPTTGFVFQSFYLQPFLQLSDNIAVPAMFTAKKKNLIDAKVTWLLQKVGLEEYANRLPKELSGGQIQRAAIARALINNPRIILADEPTGNLDSTNSQSIIDLFREIRSTLGSTIVIATHDASIARQADRVIELKDGAIT